MKCAVYPYSDVLYPLLEHRHELTDGISIEAAVYPRAWRKLLLHEKVLEQITSGFDFEALTADVECVIFADVTDREYMYADILAKAEYTLSAGKNVIFCTKMQEHDITELRSKYPDRSVTVKYGTAGRTAEQIYGHEDIRCAAVGIAPLYRGLDEAASVVGIHEAFRRKGLRTAAVSSNATFSLLGFYHFPIDIFSGQTDPEQQAGALNAFFRVLERSTHCDVMIVQFPDGMMKFMDEANDAYGVKAFMLTRAVAFDYFVLSSFLEIIRPEAYERIRSIVGKRFNLSLDACLFQPLTADREYSREYQRILYTRNRVPDCLEDYEALKLAMKDMIVADYDDAAAYERIADACIKKLT